MRSKLQITKRQKRILDNALFPGVLLHEFAHYLVVVMMPTTEVKDVELARHDDSHVQYEMLKPRIYKMVLIAFAPFYINTAVSLYFTYEITQIQLASYKDYLIFPIFYYIAIVTAAKALPSTEDVETPISFMREKLFTRRLPLIILFGPIYLALCLPALLLAKLRMKTLRLYYGIGISYAVVVFIVGALSSIGYIEFDILETLSSEMNERYGNYSEIITENNETQ